MGVTSVTQQHGELEWTARCWSRHSETLLHALSSFIQRLPSWTPDSYTPGPAWRPSDPDSPSMRVSWWEPSRCTCFCGRCGLREVRPSSTPSAWTDLRATSCSSRKRRRYGRRRGLLSSTWSTPIIKVPKHVYVSWYRERHSSIPCIQLGCPFCERVKLHHAFTNTRWITRSFSFLVFAALALQRRILHQWSLNVWQLEEACSTTSIVLMDNRRQCIQG